MENRFWYGLKSEVYVHICMDKVLVYDTKQKICRINDDEHVVCLIQTIEDEDSLGCVLIDKEWEIPSVQEWIQLTCDEGMAVTFPYYKEKGHPVILRPVLSLNNDVDKIQDEKIKPLYWGRNVKHFLNSINIYLNSDCHNQCLGCKDYCRQFPFCSKFEGKMGHSIAPKVLEQILSEVNGFSMNTINIFGGDIYNRISLDILENASKQYSMHFRFYVHYRNYKKDKFVDSQEVHLLIPSNFDVSLLTTICTQHNDKNRVLHFVLENKGDIQSVDEFVINNNVSSYNVHPFYTGKNASFFKENVYMNEGELVNVKLSMREIFRNQKLNANYFGVLYILPDGSIKARIDGQTLGYVGQDELVDVIYKELIINTAWRKIRDGEPCSKCVFQYLCPPPSDYERIIGKNNLCYMRNNKIHV